MRAARKLIDVDRVRHHGHLGLRGDHRGRAALLGEQDDAVHRSGADSITQLPHQGFSSGPSRTTLQVTKLAEFLGRRGAKRIFILAAQTPFALTNRQSLTAVPKYGGAVAGQVIYDREKTVFRSEVDQALRARPDFIFLNGYTPDVTILLRELFRAGWTGGKVAPAYAVNAKLLASLPAEVTEGTVTGRPLRHSPAFRWLTSCSAPRPDPYSCQTQGR